MPCRSGAPCRVWGFCKCWKTETWWGFYFVALHCACLSIPSASFHTLSAHRDAHIQLMLLSNIFIVWVQSVDIREENPLLHETHDLPSPLLPYGSLFTWSKICLFHLTNRVYFDISSTSDHTPTVFCLPYVLNRMARCVLALSVLSSLVPINCSRFCAAV